MFVFKLVTTAGQQIGGIAYVGYVIVRGRKEV
jgi:hypothetical protein